MPTKPKPADAPAPDPLYSAPQPQPAPNGNNVNIHLTCGCRGACPGVTADDLTAMEGRLVGKLDAIKSANDANDTRIIDAVTDFAANAKGDFDNIKTQLEAIKIKLEEGSVTPEEIQAVVDAANAGADAIVTTLKGLDLDPDFPVKPPADGGTGDTPPTDVTPA